MQTNHLNLCTDPDYHNCHGVAAAPTDVANLQDDQSLSDSIDDMIVELQEFPERADEDDEQRDIALLMTLYEICPWTLSEEQISQLDELFNEAERQMEFWQNRCDQICVMRGRIEEERTDYAGSDAVSVTVA